MNDQDNNIDNEEQRQERFHHVDLNHPLIAMLFKLQLDDDSSENSEPTL